MGSMAIVFTLNVCIFKNGVAKFKEKRKRRRVNGQKEGTKITGNTVLSAKAVGKQQYTQYLDVLNTVVLLLIENKYLKSIFVTFLISIYNIAFIYLEPGMRLVQVKYSDIFPIVRL